MEILVRAINRSANSTISKLYINGAFQCYVLEDKDRGLKQSMPLSQITAIKVPGETAIPEGRYNVIINFSNRFQHDMPLLENVPGYEGVRIHSGNYAKDTEGCLLLGTAIGEDVVLNSRSAFATFFPLLKKALQTEKVSLTIVRTI